MDRLEALGNSLSQITMYDIKSMYEQAKNVVLNVSEVEAKVREATNDDPWGASSTLMQDIANRTFNYPDFNEIMPSIYSRFMEKEARQWRQIYKSLQLLEYLIKHGSERVVDDARAHISTIKMLRNFHYIDDHGKDQGINVRNRAKEIVELLSDVEKIRAERRKAKANKNKYTGTGNDGLSFSSGGGGSRYGGFGSDSLYGGSGGGGYSGDDYGGSSSYGGRSSSYGGSGGFRDDRRGFEEYDAGDDEVVPKSPTRSNTTTGSTSPTATRAPQRKATAPPPAPEPAPIVDLLGGFDDDTPTAAPASSANTNKALPVVSQSTPAAQQTSFSLDDDDFGDFSAAPAPAAPATTASPAPATKPNLMEMLQSMPAAPPAANAGGFSGFGQATQSPPPAAFNVTGGSMSSFGGISMGGGSHRSTSSVSSPVLQQQPHYFGGGAPLQPTSTGTSSFSSPMRPTPSTVSSSSAVSTTSNKSSSSNFDDLWSMSMGTSSKPAANPGKSIKDLEKEKANVGLWGAGAGAAKPPTMGMQAANNSFGSFGGAGTKASGGGDDLLL